MPALSPEALIAPLSDLAREAGAAVLRVYGSDDFAVTYKDDQSPLTDADRRSHHIIAEGLRRIAPDVPVLSEEGAGVSFEQRRGWESFFLVDPLDGTKEFVNRNGEFTINIALMDEGEPAAGVIYVPVQGVLYGAWRGGGAFRQRDGQEAEPIRVRPAPETEGLVVVASRSHGSEALEDYLTTIRVKERISAGSALKFCLVAEGLADIYPRFGPTWEWDTGAGHAIVVEAGGRVTDTSGGPLGYNKEILKHRGFIAGSPGAMK
jgi:3'(2'), 5'-bisphosphate nucleotidase